MWIWCHLRYVVGAERLHINAIGPTVTAVMCRPSPYAECKYDTTTPATDNNALFSPSATCIQLSWLGVTAAVSSILNQTMQLRSYRGDVVHSVWSATMSRTAISFEYCVPAAEAFASADVLEATVRVTDVHGNAVDVVTNRMTVDLTAAGAWVLSGIVVVSRRGWGEGRTTRNHAAWCRLCVHRHRLARRRVCSCGVVFVD